MNSVVIHRATTVFFSIVTCLMIASFVIPSLLGLNDIRQWAGMYTNNQCSIERMSGAFEHVGRMGRTKSVWTLPSFTPRLCYAYLHEIFCPHEIQEKQSADVPTTLLFRGQIIERSSNLCVPPFLSTIPSFW